MTKIPKKTHEYDVEEFRRMADDRTELLGLIHELVNQEVEEKFKEHKRDSFNKRPEREKAQGETV